jgi:predicted Zn-dependent protease
MNNLAWLYHEKKDPRALAIAEKAYNEAPQAAAVADTYGWILIQNRNIEKGLEILQKAAEAAPGEPQIQLHFAHALAESGQRDRAIAVARKLAGPELPAAVRAEAGTLISRLEKGS